MRRIGLMPGQEKNGAPGEIRTPDLLLRRQPLYPAELRARTVFTVYMGQGNSFNVALSASRTDVADSGNRWRGSTVAKEELRLGSCNATAEAQSNFRRIFF